MHRDVTSNSPQTLEKNLSRKYVQMYLSEHFKENEILLTCKNVFLLTFR